MKEERAGSVFIFVTLNLVIWTNHLEHFESAFVAPLAINACGSLL